MKQDRRRWKVCFETNYWGTQKGTDPGEELCLDREFEWNGHRWQIPALYRCRQGLVVDFAMEVPQEELRAFMKKWGIAEDGECTRTLTRAEERQMEQENPLDGGFCAELVLNGMRLRPRNIKRLMFSCVQCGQCLTACDATQSAQARTPTLQWEIGEAALRETLRQRREELREKR